MKVITFDPPLTDISMDEHDYVRVEIISSKKAIEWFLAQLTPELKDRIICEIEHED